MQPYKAVEENGKRGIELNFHKYQWKAWDSEGRFVCILAGTQGGKTSFGPIWLWREIAKMGAGDYLVVTPTYPLLIKKALPEFLKLFKSVLGLGNYVAGDKKIFTFSKDGEKLTFGADQGTKTQIFFGHAQDPDSLESATAKGAWLDECGQRKFKLDSYHAVLRRLSIHMGRVLMTTTPYNLGWLKTEIWDKWQAGNQDEIDVIRFRSIDNPVFPREEYDRARRDLPRWKFDMFYNALFTRPAGMIYDCFDDNIHLERRFAIPDSWKRYLGVDFGGVNTAGVFLAQNPDNGNLYIYREYHKGGMTSAEHAKSLLDGEIMPTITSGGAKSEGQWRREFRTSGLPIREPLVSDVEVGIDRVYGGFKNSKLFVFNDLNRLKDEIGSYSRKLDANQQPTEVIEDKNSYHLLDALRYIVPYVIKKDVGSKTSVLFWDGRL